MIKEFKEVDKRVILDYAYLRERENLFVIGNLNRPTSFKENVYLGYFEGNTLQGIGTYFRKYGNYVVNTDNQNALNALVDKSIDRSFDFKDIANFQKYALPALRRLKSRGIEPMRIDKEIIYELQRAKFKDLSEKGNARKATQDDIDGIIQMHRLADNKDPRPPITIEEQSMIIPDETFIIKEDVIISTVNIQGTSANYFQLGGVVTHPDYRRKGYAKQCVSALCSHYFDEGKSTAILFTRDDNIAAQHVYTALGFEPVDDFIIARFESTDQS